MADMNVAPLKIVGVEGLFGSLIMLVAVLPIVQQLPGTDGKGLHEDSVDTWHVRVPPWLCLQHVHSLKKTGSACVGCSSSPAHREGL